MNAKEPRKQKKVMGILISSKVMILKSGLECIQAKN